MLMDGDPNYVTDLKTFDARGRGRVTIAQTLRSVTPGAKMVLLLREPGALADAWRHAARRETAARGAARRRESGEIIPRS